MPFFRPLPVLTLLSIPALALLILLGVWQLDRMDQKRAAIAQWEDGQSRVERTLQEAFCEVRSSAIGHRVRLEAASEGPELRFHGRGPDGVAGWRIFRAIPVPCVGGYDFILAETGFETLRGSRAGAPNLHRVLTPPPQGAFDARNDPARREFYSFDADAMAPLLDLPEGSIWPYGWVVAEGADLPAHLAQTPPERHFGYAVTWFGLALALVAVYLAYHAANGRLGFTRR